MSRRVRCLAGRLERDKRPMPVRSNPGRLLALILVLHRKRQRTATRPGGRLLPWPGSCVLAAAGLHSGSFDERCPVPMRGSLELIASVALGGLVISSVASICGCNAIMDLGRFSESPSARDGGASAPMRERSSTGPPTLGPTGRAWAIPSPRRRRARSVMRSRGGDDRSTACDERVVVMSPQHTGALEIPPR